MLSKQNRLSLRTDRFRVEREGITRHSPLFILIAAPSPTPGTPSRFAVIIGKKLAPRAVDRHRLKRVISEVIRLHLDQFPGGTDFILIPKKPALTASQPEILANLTNLV